MTLSLLCRIYVVYFYEDPQGLFQVTESELLAWQRELDSLDAQRPAPVRSSVRQFSKHSTLFHFDPDTLSAPGWEKLGFSPAQAASIIKYRQRLGGFSQENQIESCFVISEEKFSELRPYMHFSEKPAQAVALKAERLKEEKEALIRVRPDLNYADVSELTAVKGIGEFTATRIIDYRNALGGFLDYAQLSEIRGLDSTRIALLQDQCDLKPGVFRRMDINALGYREMRMHPYMDEALARLIVRYRELHGNYASVDDLKRLALMDEEKFRRLAPYLKVLN